MFAVQVVWKQFGKRRNEQFFIFPAVFSSRLENFLQFSSDLKNVCKLSQFGPVRTIVFWERVNPTAKLRPFQRWKYFRMEKTLLMEFVFEMVENFVRKGEDSGYQHFHILLTMFFKSRQCPPGWLSGERDGLMIWWLWVRSPVEATFLSGVFSPLTSAEACEKSSRWRWKEKLC